MLSLARRHVRPRQIGAFDFNVKLLGPYGLDQSLIDLGWEAKAAERVSIGERRGAIRARLGPLGDTTLMATTHDAIYADRRGGGMTADERLVIFASSLGTVFE